ncbi:MAG TPA: hypothetical protein VFS05_10110 [Gemmatimonadaceae bacterium]|nr:hypothetical protein [Gemmatimonadaceae bacterium]
MMRPLVVLSLSIAAAACAHRVPAVAEGLEGSMAPLSARLEAPMDGVLRFSTSRPAYVAIFEIVPGSGASLLYPANLDEPRMLSEGFHQQPVLGVVPGRWFYYRNAGSSWDARYLFLVASERPLKLSRLQQQPATLRSALGYSTFTSVGVTRTMDALSRLVVRDYEADDWVTDFYTIVPPPPPPQRMAFASTLIRCTDGTVRAYPTELLATQALRRTPNGYVCPPATSGERPTPGDSAGAGGGRPVDSAVAVAPARTEPEAHATPSPRRYVGESRADVAEERAARRDELAARRDRVRRADDRPATAGPRGRDARPAMREDRGGPPSAARARPAESRAAEPRRTGPRAAERVERAERPRADRPAPVRAERVRAEPVRSQPARTEPRESPRSAQPERTRGAT